MYMYIYICRCICKCIYIYVPYHDLLSARASAPHQKHHGFDFLRNASLLGDMNAAAHWRKRANNIGSELAPEDSPTNVRDSASEPKVGP